MALLGARSNVPNQAEALVNTGIGLSNREQLLDLRQNVLYCLTTIASDQNHAVKGFLEGGLPGRIEFAIGRFGASIVKTLRTGKLAGLEGIVTNIIGDTQLLKQKTINWSVLQ